MRPDEVEVGQEVWIKNPWVDSMGNNPMLPILKGKIEQVNEANARRACWVSGVNRWLYPEALHRTREEADNVPAATVPAYSFVATVNANVDNEKLTDAEFREFVRNSLPLVRELFVEPLSSV